MATKSTKPELHPVKFHDETRYVTVPGSGDQEPAPESEEGFEAFLAEAIEAYAEESDMPRPHIRTFAEAGVLTSNKGLDVRFGENEHQVTIVRSR